MNIIVNIKKNYLPFEATNNLITFNLMNKLLEEFHMVPYVK